MGDQRRSERQRFYTAVGTLPFGRRDNMKTLVIPEYDTEDTRPYPGSIKPGEYAVNELVDMLRQNAHNPDAILFIADMLEE